MLNKMLLMNNQGLQHLVYSIGIEAMTTASGSMMERGISRWFVDSSNSHGLSINSSEVSLTTWSKNLSIASLALRTFCGGLMKLKIIDSSTKFYVNSIKLHSVALSQTVKHELKTGAPSDAYYLGGLSSIYQIYFGRLGHIGIRALNRSMLKL